MKKALIEISADGLNNEMEIGLLGFQLLLKSIAYSYDYEFGKEYAKIVNNNEDNISNANKRAEDLNILLFNKNIYDGLKYLECQKVIKELDKINFKVPDNYNPILSERFLQLKNIIRYCAKNKKRLNIDEKKS